MISIIYKICFDNFYRINKSRKKIIGFARLINEATNIVFLG